MNLNKFTKAELISKLNSIKQPNNSKDSIFNNFMTLLLMIKSFLLKITLIAFLFRIFKKYNIFRKIFAIINTILFSIFGFSLIDFYEIDVLSKYFHKIIDIFANFHSSILELFGKKIEKVDLPTKNEALGRISKETNGIQTNNENSKGIIERYKKIIHGEEIKSEVTPEVIQENTPYYKNKYVIIAGLLMLSGLAWYFADDIRPVGTTILGWINLLKSRRNNDDDPGDINPEVQVNSRWNLNRVTELKDSIKRKVYGESKVEDNPSTNSPIKMGESSKSSDMDHYFPEADKGKTIDLNNLSQAELERRGLGSEHKPEIILSDITGDNSKFITEANQVLREVRVFNDMYDNQNFSTATNCEIVFKAIKLRLETLADNSPILYQDIILKDVLNERVEKFWKIGDKLNIDQAFSNNETYNEAEKAASEEKDIWSDRGNSPQQVLSPELMAETAMETMEKDRAIPQLVINNIEKVVEIIDNDEPVTPSKKELDTYWHGLKTKAKNIWNKNISIPEEDELLSDDAIAGPSEIKDEVVTLVLLKDKENPKIEISKHSTPEEMKDYFIKEESNNTVEETKPIEDSKIEIIHSEELDNIAKNLTPRIKDDYIEPDNAKVFENLDPKLLPDLDYHSKIKTMKVNQIAEGYFSQESTSQIKDTLSKENEIFFSKENIENKIKERPNIAETLKAIRSKRLEYGSPSVANIGLPRGELSPLILNQDSSNLPDINEGIDLENDNSEDNNHNEKDSQERLPLHNWNDEIKFNINKGQPYNRFIDVDFGDNQKDISKILIITNDGISNTINPNTVVSHNHKNSFKWDIKGTSNSYWRDLDIYSITIIDKNSTGTNIYQNKNIKFLENFKDNISQKFK